MAIEQRTQHAALRAMRNHPTLGKQPTPSQTGIAALRADGARLSAAIVKADASYGSLLASLKSQAQQAASKD